MKREDLFLAIGEVEEERLARSGQLPSDVTHQEEITMKNKENKHTGRRIIRNLLIAAVLVTMLATTAFAYVGFVVYDSPRAMLEAFFGEQPAPHGPDCRCAECLAKATEPVFERVPLDEEVAEQEVSPYVGQIGDSVSFGGYTMTVESHVYDPFTRVGLVYYTLEKDPSEPSKWPIEYQLQYDGETTWLPGYCNQYGYDYLDQKQSTDEKLYIAQYYVHHELHEDFLRIGFESHIRDEDGKLIEEDWSHCLTLPLESGETMDHLSLADGGIKLSPIGIVIYGEKAGLPDSGEYTEVESLTVRYADGTEYEVENEENNVMNYIKSVGNADGTSSLTYILNRIVDIDNVTAVVINGTEFSVT